MGELIDALLGLKDAQLKTLAIEIMIAHALKAGAEQIASIVADAKADLPVLPEAQQGALELVADVKQSILLTAEEITALYAP